MLALVSMWTVKTATQNLPALYPDARGSILPSGGTALIGMVGIGTLESGISGSNIVISIGELVTHAHCLGTPNSTVRTIIHVLFFMAQFSAYENWLNSVFTLFICSY